MSGIFGVFNRDGEPVSRNTIENLLKAASSWEPDEHGVWMNGVIALGHTMLWNTPASTLENLPNTSGHFTITMDARLDNREELARRLYMTDRPLNGITDSDFIQAAYGKWGEDCPRHLLGDFAFAIWDEREKKLFCARDHLGIKPFYYHVTDRLFVFSDDIRALVAHPHVPKDFNEEAIAVYLKKAGLLHPTITFFKGIDKLPPASSLSVRVDRIKTTTYWAAENSPDIRLGSLDDYSGLLKDLLREAVDTRLSSDYPIASHLSGGLDSSAIAVMASRELGKRNRTLHAYNWVQAPSDDDDPNHHEWANSRRIAQLENISHHHLELDELMLSDIFSSCDLATNDSADLWYEFPLRKIAADQGIRTMLSGWGGDELISYAGGGYYAEAFWRNRSFSIVSELYEISKRGKAPWRRFLGSCYRNLFLPVIPDAFYCHFPRVNCSDLGSAELIDPGFLQKLKQHRSFGESIPRIGVRDCQLGLLHYGHIVSRTESWAASSKRMDYRYPLLDKRVVEFALGIPGDLYLRKGKGRYIFRQAIADLLPADICWGEMKSEPARVDRYLDISLKSHSYWLENTLYGYQLPRSNHYVNVDKLCFQIRKTKRFRPEDRDSLIEISDGIGMAIMVLGMGRSMKDAGVSPMLQHSE